MHTKILNEFYEWPRTRQEYNIFYKEVLKLPDFWKEMGKKLTFGLVTAAGDTGLKLAWFNHVYGGIWHPADLPDYNTFKHVVVGITAALPFCWSGLPFMNARRAYYADKTWPIELRRNYRSPINALMRIPFEEGPTYLFRGAFPVMGFNFSFWSMFLGTYTYLKNKFYFMVMYNDFNYSYIKFLELSFSFGFASVLAYPFLLTREMVDLWPKERGGHCTWNNNYRQCARWMLNNIEFLYGNFLANYWIWMRRQGAGIFAATWAADSMGVFCASNEPFSSLES